MPWQKFESLYEAHAKRLAVEAAERVRNAQISGVWANSNFDAHEEGQQSPRTQILEEIYNNYIEAIKLIYNPELARQEERERNEIDWDDPFFKAMKVPSNPYFNAETSPLPHDHNSIDQM